jgi:hypothetical protein
MFSLEPSGIALKPNEGAAVIFAVGVMPFLMRLRQILRYLFTPSGIALKPNESAAVIFAVGET